MLDNRGNKDILETNLLLEQVFENAADGMCILNTDYEVIKVSHKLVKSLGLTKEDLIGKKCNEVILLSFCNTADCPMNRIKKGEKYFTYEANYKIGNKSVPFLITATPLMSSNNEIEGLILSYKDITDLIKHQKELQMAKDKAEEENFLKTQFLANISHEIRTPMNGILGLIELFGETQLDPKQEEYMDLIKYSADRLLSILDNILDFSKIKANKLEVKRKRFNLIHLLENIKKFFYLQASGKGLDFNWKVNDKLPNMIIGDPDCLNQILFNLLSNAIKFTESGHVGLQVDIKGQDAKNIELSFSVIDTGIGIPEDKISHFFKEFYQTDLSSTKKYGGSGLGLTITKELIEKMGGEISVSSQVGMGSKFTFNIKFEKVNLLVHDEEYSLKKDKDINIDRLNNLNILVVDDDLINQKIIFNMLEKSNWNISLESNGEKVLDLVRKNNYDLIILDIFMPGMDGYEIARQIRKIESRNGVYTPIIAITATTTMECREKCENIGFDEFIIKPIRAEEAYKKIISILRERRGIDNIQLNGLLDRIDNDADLLRELVEEVISDSYEREHLGKMGIYIENGDLNRLKESIHKFKGSISNFSADEIIRLLREMEASIEKDKLNSIREIYVNLREEFNKLKEKYRQLIETKGLY